MSGPELRKLQDVLMSAFDEDDLRQLITYELDLNLDTVTAPGSLNKRTFDLIRYMDMQGRVPELVTAIARARPRREDVQAFYRDYSAGIAKAVRPPQNAAATYDNLFAGKPPVDLQNAGRPVASDVPSRDPGLERMLNQELGFINAAVWGATFGLMQGRVCKVEMNDAYRTVGTGFLVGPESLVTANHVMKSLFEANANPAAVRFRFDFHTTPGGGTTDGFQVGLFEPASTTRPWLLAESATSVDGGPASDPSAPFLDYVLVRLARAVGNEPVAGNPAARGWVDVPDTQPKLDGQPLVSILQHPKGQALKLAFDTRPNVRVSPNGWRVGYEVNTEEGSSGSPVFDKEWKLLAMHHFGRDTSNQGVPIGLIRASLPATAVAFLGAATDGVGRLKAASAAVKAVTVQIGQGTVNTPAQAADVAAKAASESILAGGLVAKLSKTVRESIDRQIGQSDKDLADAIEKSKDPKAWQKAADVYRRDICALLRVTKQLNGGVLPDELLDLWTDNGCA